MKWTSGKDYERLAEEAPLLFGLRAVLFIAVLLGAAGGISYGFGWCGETAKVAQDEVGPKALLQKYMWLKEAHAQLEKKQADIKVYKASVDTISAQYKGVARRDWARDDRDAFNQRSTELAGVVASYNDLAAQYNAKMVEINWKFTNIGELPNGSTEPLPREYAPYKSE